jgi:hypothetical protein
VPGRYAIRRRLALAAATTTSNSRANVATSGGSPTSCQIAKPIDDSEATPERTRICHGNRAATFSTSVFLASRRRIHRRDGVPSSRRLPEPGIAWWAEQYDQPHHVRLLRWTGQPRIRPCGSSAHCVIEVGRQRAAAGSVVLCGAHTGRLPPLSPGPVSGRQVPESWRLSQAGGCPSRRLRRPKWRRVSLRAPNE